MTTCPVHKSRAPNTLVEAKAKDQAYQSRQHPSQNDICITCDSAILPSIAIAPFSYSRSASGLVGILLYGVQCVYYTILLGPVEIFIDINLGCVRVLLVMQGLALNLPS